jgi:ribosomal protein S3
MGQKTNPIVFRLGKIKEWKSHYIEKKTTESSSMIFQDLELKKYIQQLFLTHNLKILNCLTYFSAESLHLYISYYNLATPSLYNKKKFKLTHKKREKFLSKKFKKNASLLKTKTIKYHLYKIKAYKKKFFKTTRFLQDHYFSIKKTQRLSTLKQAEICLNKKNYRTLNKENSDGFVSKILKGINLFTKKRYNIFLNLNQINNEKNIIKIIKKKNKFKLQKKFVELRKYQRNDFFKSGLNILYSFTINEQDPTFLADFIAYYLKKLKRPTFFLRFLTVALKAFLSSKFSDLRRVYIKIRGRLNRAPRSKIKSINIGKAIPIATLNSNIDYGESTAYTSNGTFGIKIWVLKTKSKKYNVKRTKKTTKI